MICNAPDDDVFSRQCQAMEARIPNLKKGKLLIDVDGSQTQLYSVDSHRISVHNSYYIGAVYVKSEIDLIPFFSIRHCSKII